VNINHGANLSRHAKRVGINVLVGIDLIKDAQHT